MGTLLFEDAGNLRSRFLAEEEVAFLLIHALHLFVDSLAVLVGTTSSMDLMHVV